MIAPCGWYLLCGLCVARQYASSLTYNLRFMECNLHVEGDLAVALLMRAQVQCAAVAWAVTGNGDHHDGSCISLARQPLHYKFQEHRPCQ